MMLWWTSGSVASTVFVSSAGLMRTIRFPSRSVTQRCWSGPYATSQGAASPVATTRIANASLDRVMLSGPWPAERAAASARTRTPEASRAAIRRRVVTRTLQSCDGPFRPGTRSNRPGDVMRSPLRSGDAGVALRRPVRNLISYRQPTGTAS
jgi:hypothetical protein